MKPDDLAALGAERRAPAYSLYLPLRGRDPDAHRIALKTAWKETDAAMPDEVRALLDDPAAWNPDALGLAVFSSPASTTLRWLPFAPERTVCCGERFAIAPMVELLGRETVFGVLAFQLGGWRFLQCTPGRSEPLRIDHAPRSLDDATRAVVEPVPGGASHAHTAGPGASPTMQPQGFGHEDRRKNDALLYIRDLDAALVAVVGKRLPVVLFGSPPWTSMVQEHSDLNLVAVEATNPGDLDDATLRATAWAHIEAQARPAREATVASIHTAMAHDRGSDDLAEVAQMARQGGVEALLVDVRSDDLAVSEAIALTLTHGGQVVPANDPDVAVAAAYRWEHRA